MPPETVLTSDFLGEPARIVRKGGTLQAYRPLDLYPGLASAFVTLTKTPAGLLDFIQKFGPLTHFGLDPKEGELVGELLDQRRQMADLLEMLARAKKPGSLLNQWVDIQLPPVSVTVIADQESKRIRLRMSPPTLLSAIWLDLAQRLSGSRQLRACQHCGQWFEVGQGTGRRLDARFCRDEHRVAFNSLRRSTKQGRTVYRSDGPPKSSRKQSVRKARKPSANRT